MTRKIFMKEIIFITVVLALSFYPFMKAYFSNVNLCERAASPYLNGLITTCGIFLAFISAAAISRSELLDSFDYKLVRASLIIFVAAIFFLSDALIFGEPAISEALWIQSSLIFNSITAFWLIGRIYRKSHGDSGDLKISKDVRL